MKVGDYVRTKDGLIAKYIECNNELKFHLFDGKIQWDYDCYRDDIDDEDWEDFKKEKILKVSPNIIDLIQVGDYVNGLKITYIYEPNEYNSQRTLCFEYPIDYVIKTFYSEDIKSIVTKEQFESVQYEVK